MRTCECPLECNNVCILYGRFILQSYFFDEGWKQHTMASDASTAIKHLVCPLTLLFKKTSSHWLGCVSFDTSIWVVSWVCKNTQITFNFARTLATMPLYSVSTWSSFGIVFVVFVVHLPIECFRPAGPDDVGWFWIMRPLPSSCNPPLGGDPNDPSDRKLHPSTTKLSDEQHKQEALMVVRGRHSAGHQTFWCQKEKRKKSVKRNVRV